MGHGRSNDTFESSSNFKYQIHTHRQAIRFLSTNNNRNPFSVLLAVSCLPWYPLLRARQVQAAAAVGAAAMKMNLLHQQR